MEVDEIMRDLGVKVNIDDKLFLNRFKADDKTHLFIKDNRVCSKRCLDKVCTIFCPANVYEWKGDRIAVGYEGCLECGACRIACPFENIDWQYPRGGFGVQYRLA